MNNETDRQITIRMPKAKLKKWLAALRSGEYKQGTGVLYNEHDQSFCCLGVLQHAVDRGNVECDPDSCDNEFRDMPTKQWLEEQNITFEHPIYPLCPNDPFLPAFDASAADANDDLKKNFKEIADAIEACAEGF